MHCPSRRLSPSVAPTFPRPSPLPPCPSPPSPVPHPALTNPSALVCPFAHPPVHPSARPLPVRPAAERSFNIPPLWIFLSHKYVLAVGTPTVQLTEAAAQLSVHVAVIISLLLLLESVQHSLMSWRPQQCISTPNFTIIQWKLHLSWFGMWRSDTPPGVV